MTTKLNDRALRVLASALLNSSFTSNELHQVCDELKFGTLGPKLGRILSGLIHSLNTYPYTKDASTDRSKVPDMLDLLKNKKLSKDQVLQIMKQVLGTSKLMFNPKSSLRDLVTAFLDLATEQQRSEFLELADHYSQIDPYLKGITNR